MDHHTIVGGGGVRLHVVEGGDPRGRAILFIHGVSQCWLSWSRQLDGGWAGGHRLVAMDMRGHGLSEKPRGGYADSKLWADDVDAVIRALRLDAPVLCGWSYGPLVILDYLRHYGEDGVGGLVFVGGVTGLGSDSASAVISNEFLGLVPGFFATDVEESERSLRGLALLCLARQPSPEDLFTMVGYSVSVPPRVRQQLLSREVNNDDLLPKIARPLLIVQGERDAVVKRQAVDEQKARVAHARVAIIPGAGHAAFWDEAAEFNSRIESFCGSLPRRGV